MEAHSPHSTAGKRWLGTKSGEEAAPVLLGQVNWPLLSLSPSSSLGKRCKDFWESLGVEDAGAALS